MVGTHPHLNTHINTVCNDNKNADDYHIVLLAIYSVVLLSGTISLSLMIHIMKSSKMSTTTIAVHNLIFTHFIFLLTVPFRIYYYASNHWSLSSEFCKVVSGMIHIHMYMSFIFYVIIIVMRLLTFYYKAEQVAPFNRIHALLVSAVVWIVVLVVVPLIMYYYYGKNAEDKSLNNSTTVETHCFKFGKHIIYHGKAFNYIVSPVIIVVATVLTSLQANVVRVLYRKHPQGCTYQQEFGAQLNGLCFALIMAICFIPYNIFRLNYLENIQLENINELFLSLTTLNCLDMLTFLGNRNFDHWMLWLCAMCLDLHPGLRLAR
uniref:G-protein coupled receptors family 1 profile domain-containing protein n=1 Tax=Mola mola TaxID=94237 RepID=A0A3Q3VWZ0_MOLML